MKLEGVFVSNVEDIDKCEKLGIDWKPETTNYPMLLNENDVKAAYIDNKGDIIIYLGSYDEDAQWRIKYNKEFWDKLNAKFK